MGRGWRTEGETHVFLEHDERTRWARSECGRGSKNVPKTRAGRHLVLIRYASGHVVNQEWVHNAAAIDESAVVRAHRTEPNGLQELLRYFSDRKVWLLETDNEPIAPRPYHD